VLTDADYAQPAGLLVHAVLGWRRRAAIIAALKDAAFLHIPEGVLPLRFPWVTARVQRHGAMQGKGYVRPFRLAVLPHRPKVGRELLPMKE